MFHLWQLLPNKLQIQLNQNDKNNICPTTYLKLIKPFLPHNIYTEQLEINTEHLNCPNLNLLSRFLLEHYTNSNVLRIYSKNLLHFYFSTNQSPVLFVIRSTNSNEILGCISCVTKKCLLNNKPMNIYYVNFLCIHKNYINSLFAIHLICSLTEYVMSRDPNLIWIFNSHKQIQNSFTTINYFSRPINISKLIKHNYFKIDFDINDENINKMIKYFSLNCNTFDFIKCSKIDSQEIFDKINNFRSSKILSCFINIDEINKIINNNDFISIKIISNNEIIAYCDLYILKEITQNVINVAMLNNFFYPLEWDDNEKIKFINSLIKYLDSVSIDECIVSDQFFHKIYNIQHFKFIYDSKSFINYDIDNIISHENTLVNF